MTEANVFQLSQPGTFADPLTAVLRNGARALLAQAVEAEASALLASHADKLTEDGRQRLVRHGHLPEREVMTGIGPVAVRCPRVRDRVGEGSERIRFSSAILPPYGRWKELPGAASKLTRVQPQPSPYDEARLDDAKRTLRDLASQMRSFTLNEPLAVWVLTLFRYDLTSASAALFGLSEVFDRYGNSRHSNRKTIEKALRFRD